LMNRRAGHELRNPLHGVCAGVSALRGGRLPPGEAAVELAAIAEGLALIVSITNDMTDLNKLRAGQFSVKCAPTNMRGVLESCICAVGPALQDAADVALLYDANMPEMVSARGRPPANPRARRGRACSGTTAPPCGRGRVPSLN
jgi:signal transduction histidine kinase